MAISPQEFRDEYYRCTWIFDLFAHGFDYLNGRFFPHADPALENLWESERERIDYAEIEAEIISADGAIPVIVKRYLDLPGGDAGMEAQEFCMRLFSILSAIDRVAGLWNHLSVYSPPGSRWSNAIDYFERKKQLQDKASGYVIFKPRYFKQDPAQEWLGAALRGGKTWTNVPPRGEELGTHFENIIRTPDIKDCDFRILSSTQDFGKLDWKSLRIGIVPLVEQLNVRDSDAQLLPGPLVIKKDTAAPATFGIHIEGPATETCSDLCARAEVALRYLAEQGCQFVLFPEMVVPDPVVTRLKTVLGELAGLDRPRPGLVLAGTFTRMVPEYSSTMPFNVAIVLNHSGEELWRQRKMHPYDMKRHEQRIFGLESLLNSESCRENITFSKRKLHLVDSRVTGMRMVVLICEDATRDPGLRAVQELQPSLILAPVMAGPLETTGGFAKGIRQALEQTPAIFVVANSAALARAAWGEKDGAPPLAIVGLPLLNISEDYQPFSVVREWRSVSGSPSVQVLIYQFPT